MSRAVGRLCEQPLPAAVSRAVTGAYIRAYGVDMQDVAESGVYPSFDAFFTRPLRQGARAISSDSVVSPADGRLVDAGVIDPRSELVVKGRGYGVAELVGDAAEAERLAGGSFAVVYLSPRDYHRVHSPVDGELSLIRGIPGDLYPVNAIGEQHVPKLFARNQRVALFLDTKSHGRVAVILVGAMIVGRISVVALGGSETPLGVFRVEPPRQIHRGDEIGMFHLGSTVVVLTGKGTPLARRPGVVRYGETLLSP
ncbi:MAG TPA: archaetidylserine decarboxylase [Polyangiaceae bacterium]|nr:archaetidylserine decarboxylase [Polyangiaceae bacterium]